MSHITNRLLFTWYMLNVNLQYIHKRYSTVHFCEKANCCCYVQKVFPNFKLNHPIFTGFSARHALLAPLLVDSWTLHLRFDGRNMRYAWRGYGGNYGSVFLLASNTSNHNSKSWGSVALFSQCTCIC